MSVSAKELIRSFGFYADKALTQPVLITKNGRDRLMLVSFEDYEAALKRQRMQAAPGGQVSIHGER